MAGKVKLTEAQRRGLEFLAKSPWKSVWWGGKPHGNWPKELNARAYDKLVSLGLVGWESAGGFARKITITPAGRAEMAWNPEDFASPEVKAEIRRLDTAVTPGSAELLAELTELITLSGDPNVSAAALGMRIRNQRQLYADMKQAFRLAAKPDEEGVREADLCAGGVRIGFDECPKCGAIMDEECKAPKSTAKTCLDDIGLKITSELYKAVSGHTGDACLLAMIGSWGDTLDDPDILAGLHRYNEMGECFIPDASTTGQPKAMSIVGPFIRPRPSASTTIVRWQYCYLWLNDFGHLVAIEWIEP